MATKYCTNCGAEMPAESKFCTECGTPFPAADKQKETQVQQGRPAEEQQAPAQTPPQPQESAWDDAQLQNDATWNVNAAGAGQQPQPQESQWDDQDRTQTAYSLQQQNQQQAAGNVWGAAQQQRPQPQEQGYAWADNRPQSPVQQGQPMQPVSQGQPFQQTGMVNPAAITEDHLKGTQLEPVSAFGWCGINLLMKIPIVNLIVALVWACGGCWKKTKRSYARGWLLSFVIIAALTFLAVLLLLKIVTGLLIKYADANDIAYGSGTELLDILNYFLGKFDLQITY